MPFGAMESDRHRSMVDVRTHPWRQTPSEIAHTCIHEVRLEELAAEPETEENRTKHGKRERQHAVLDGSPAWRAHQPQEIRITDLPRHRRRSVLPASHVAQRTATEARRPQTEAGCVLREASARLRSLPRAVPLGEKTPAGRLCQEARKALPRHDLGGRRRRDR
eukprot:scaffold431_cov334-Pavlova_lutheri.AAC.6